MRCGLFLLQAAPFLMVGTTIIYAGAIIVTFLFVLMLAQQEGYSDADQRSREPLLVSLTGFVLLGALLYVLQQTYGTRDLDRLMQAVRPNGRTAPIRGSGSWPNGPGSSQARTNTTSTTTRRAG